MLTWYLTSWSLFTGLFFTLKNPYLAQKMFFLINFIRILWFIWDLRLMLFDNQKGVVSGKNFSFRQYFGFSGGKLGPKMYQNHQLCVRPVSTYKLNFERLFRGCLCLVKDVPLVEISANSSHISRRKGPETTQKWPFHGCCITTKTFENL